MSLPRPKPLHTIFTMSNPSELAFELKLHCFAKEVECNQPLTKAEHVFDSLVRMGGYIAGDGFRSVYHQIFTPESFETICDALTEVGGIKLRDLLREAWSIYTQGKDPITVDELRAISVRRFNTRELMERFDTIGGEVMKDIEEQYAAGKVWSVEYAKLHRDEFEPIKE